MNINTAALGTRRVTVNPTQTSSLLPYQGAIQERNAAVLHLACDALKQNINQLRAWKDNWDSFGSAKPKTVCINNAEKWLEELLRLAKEHSLEWIEPLISGDENGNVVLEWWNNSKKLTLDIEPLMAEYTQISDLYGEPKLYSGSLGGNAERKKTDKILPLLKWILS